MIGILLGIPSSIFIGWLTFTALHLAVSVLTSEPTRHSLIKELWDSSVSNLGNRFSSDRLKIRPLSPVRESLNFRCDVSVGPNVKKSPTDLGTPIKLDCALIISSTRSARKHAKSLQSTFLFKASPIKSATTTDRNVYPTGLLCIIALWNSVPAPSIKRCNPIITAPADSPNKVILSGSPPNASIFFLTQSSAAL